MADSKLSALTAETTFTGDELMFVVDDPSGTPVDRKATISNIVSAVAVNAAGATMNTDTDVSGNSWVLDEDDLTSDSATKVPTQQSVKAYVDANSGASAGGLLSIKQHNPATLATYTASGSWAAADATNLVLPDFTVPASGEVLVVASGFIACSNNSGRMQWAILNSGGSVVGPEMFALYSLVVDATRRRVTARWVIDGLTPDATISGWRWGIKHGGAGSSAMYVQSGSDNQGPALIEVWPVPT